MRHTPLPASLFLSLSQRADSSNGLIAVRLHVRDQSWQCGFQSDIYSPHLYLVSVASSKQQLGLRAGISPSPSSPLTPPMTPPPASPPPPQGPSQPPHSCSGHLPTLAGRAEHLLAASLRPSAPARRGGPARKAATAEPADGLAHLRRRGRCIPSRGQANCLPLVLPALPGRWLPLGDVGSPFVPWPAMQRERTHGPLQEDLQFHRSSRDGSRTRAKEPPARDPRGDSAQMPWVPAASPS